MKLLLETLEVRNKKIDTGIQTFLKPR